METIKEYINGLSGDYEAGSENDKSLAKIDGTYTLSWAWAYGDNSTDQADTLLGDLAANNGLVTGVDTNDYNLKTEFSISISITQID